MSKLLKIKNPQIGDIYRVAKGFTCYYSDDRTSKALNDYVTGKTTIIPRYPTLYKDSLILILSHKTIEQKSETYYNRVDYFEFLYNNEKFLSFMVNKRWLSKVIINES